MPKIYEMIAEGLFRSIHKSLLIRYHWKKQHKHMRSLTKKEDKKYKSCFETLKSVKNTGDFLYAQNQTKYP